MLICKKPKIFDVDLFALAAIIGVCALTWWALIKPMDRKIVLQRQDQQTQKLSVGSAQTELDQLKGLTQQERALASWLRQTQNVLEENSGIAEVVGNTERLCDLCGLRLDEINPGDDSVTEHFNKTDLNLRLYGRFPQVQQLLARIRQDLQYVRVKSMSVAVQDAQGGRCEIVIDLDVFSAR